MSNANLLSVYTPLIGWTALGWVLGRLLPQITATYLGQFLFWIGVPISILGFLRHAQLSWSLWLAPLMAWIAMLSGIALAWWCLRSTDSPLDTRTWPNQTRGSFLLASMVGNTGYIGYPVSLALVGSQDFAWALFYDIGSTLGAYGLGVALASHFAATRHSFWQPLRVMATNPALWSFGLGVGGRDLPLPEVVEVGLRSFSWVVISLSLILVGMRLSQLKSFHRIKPAIVSLSIKMVLVPLVLGSGLWFLGITGTVHRVILLQMAMPPAFATLVIAEAYGLDRNLSVTSLIVGSLGLLITLPLWLLLFGS